VQLDQKLVLLDRGEEPPDRYAIPGNTTVFAAVPSARPSVFSE